MADRTTATIASQAERLTLIYVYEVEPEKQAELAKALADATESTIRQQPSYISVSIHSSFDDQKVVNYAQWAWNEHFEAFMKKPETQDQLKQFAGIAKSVAPSLYRVITEGTARDAQMQVREDWLDVAFMACTHEISDLHSRIIWRAPLMVVMPEAHPLGREGLELAYGRAVA